MKSTQSLTKKWKIFIGLSIPIVAIGAGVGGYFISPLFNKSDSGGVTPQVTDRLEFLSGDTLNIDASTNSVVATVSYSNTTTIPSDVSWSGQGNLDISSASWSNGVGEFTIRPGSQTTTGDVSLVCTLTIDGQTYTTTPATLHLITETTSVKITKIQGPDALTNQGDKIVLLYNTTNPDGNTIWTTPPSLTDVTFEYDNTGTTTGIMIITATARLDFSTTFDITATNNSVSDTISLQVIAPYVPIPVNSTYYDITTDITGNKTVVGFSADVVADPTIIPTECTAIDFTDKSVYDVKCVAGNARFDPTVFQKLEDIGRPILQINLSNLKWHYDSTSGCSGYNTFANCNLSSLIELNLHETDFAYYAGIDLSIYIGPIGSAASTFSNANLSNLISLDLSDVKFATANMTTNTARIASNTFFTADLSGLTSLNLAGAVFAATNMSRGAYTASSTFQNAILSNLTYLNLSNAVFAVENMCTAGDVTSASSTFQGAKLPILNSLNLTGAVFAVTNMNATGSIIVFGYTFQAATLSQLNSLNLSGAVFAVRNMHTSGRIDIVMNAFESADLSELTSLNLADVVFAVENMTTTGQVNTATNMFQKTSMPNLASLNLSRTIFAADNMTTTGMVVTLNQMFNLTNLMRLTSLDLRDTIVATDNMTTGTKRACMNTFYQATLSGLTDLYLPASNPIGCAWFITFSGPATTTSGTVHGYTTPPSWFTAAWFPTPNWTWVL